MRRGGVRGQLPRRSWPGELETACDAPEQLGFGAGGGERDADSYGGLGDAPGDLEQPQPRARYRVTNWPAYEAGLRRRGNLMLRLDEAAVAGWSAPTRSTPGGQPIYSDLAIELVLTLRLVFHLDLRQAEAFAGSILRLLGLDLSVPDHSTLSRRGRTFADRCPRMLPSLGPIHLVLDSTGLELFGQGEWNAEKHGRARRNRRKLHLPSTPAPARSQLTCFPPPSRRARWRWRPAPERITGSARSASWATWCG